jgi:glycosyltransferase involved in cell wall biosynthesis
VNVYSPDSCKYTKNRDCLNVLFLGNIARIKGVETLFDAIYSFRSNPAIQCHIAGRLPKDMALSDAFTQFLKSTPNARYLGFLDMEQKLEALCWANVLVMPSLWENCPMSCLEAMSMGKIIIASQTGGLRELIVDGKNGILMPAGSSSSLINAIERCDCMTVNERRTFEANARKSVLLFYSKQAIVPKMLQTYRNLKR